MWVGLRGNPLETQDCQLIDADAAHSAKHLGKDQHDIGKEEESAQNFRQPNLIKGEQRTGDQRHKHFGWFVPKLWELPINHQIIPQ